MKISDYCRTTLMLLVFTFINTANAHGGGGWGGGGHHGGFHHGWGYSSGIYIGGIGMGYSPYGYGYGYGPYDYYPYRPYAYPPAVVTVPTAPPVYIQQQQQQAAPAVTQEHPVGFWYYCTKPAGYYPYIKECSTGWQQVAPTPTDKQEDRK